MFEKVFVKNQIFTIPNLLSAIRLVLIPFIVTTFFKGHYTTALILTAVSAFTDVIDGRIARHFNMISDLGKMLDPLADKLTEGALIICLISRYKLMIALLMVMACKETMMVVMGLKALKNDSVNSARWYGKVCTVFLYAVMMALLLFVKIPRPVANGLIIACMVMAIFTMIMYIRFYRDVLQQLENEKNQKA